MLEKLRKEQQVLQQRQERDAAAKVEAERRRRAEEKVLEKVSAKPKGAAKKKNKRGAGPAQLPRAGKGGEEHMSAEPQSQVICMPSKVTIQRTLPPDFSPHKCTISFC